MDVKDWIQQLIGQDVLIRGGSCIIGPLGRLLAGPKFGEECILTADLDRADQEARGVAGCRMVHRQGGDAVAQA